MSARQPIDDGFLRLDPASRMVTVGNDVKTLSDAEFVFLYTLVSRRFQVCSHERLADAVGRPLRHATLSSLICQIRWKIGDGRRTTIRSVFKVGYIYSPVLPSPAALPAPTVSAHVADGNSGRMCVGCGLTWPCPTRRGTPAEVGAPGYAHAERLLGMPGGGS